MGAMCQWAGRFRTLLWVAMLGAAAGCGQTTREVVSPAIFYGTVGNPAEGKLVSIEIGDAGKVAIASVGAMGAFGCAALARSSAGELYSVCGPGIAEPDQPQQLARVDAATGRATTFGKAVTGLQVMALEFAPDGTLYAVGDLNAASPTFNSFYTVDVKTGEFTRIGTTGVPAPEFFMDFAFARDGTLYGASSHALFTIDRQTGTATKVTDFVGGGDIMGLSFDVRQDRLFATDYKAPNSALYAVDPQNGFLTPLAAMGQPLAHSLVSANP